MPFFANISMLLRNCHGFTLVESGELMALASLTVTLLCPLIGYVSDKIQRRGTLLVISLAISSLTQAAILALPYSEKLYYILIPLTLNQFGFALFVANVWPALSVLLKECHPEEHIAENLEDAHDIETDSMRQNLAIGLANSWINLGQGCAPLFIGYLLDSSIHSIGEEEDYEGYGVGFIKINVFMLTLDSVAFLLLFVWVVLQPHMLNKTRKIVGSDTTN